MKFPFTTFKFGFIDVLRVACLVAVIWFSLESPFFAQGCAMCKAAAGAQSSQAIAALNRGILFLLIPPVTIMTGILVWAFRRCNSPRQELDAFEPEHQASSIRSI